MRTRVVRGCDWLRQSLSSRPIAALRRALRFEATLTQVSSSNKALLTGSLPCAYLGNSRVQVRHIVQGLYCVRNGYDNTTKCTASMKARSGGRHSSGVVVSVSDCRRFSVPAHGALED